MERDKAIDLNTASHLTAELRRSGVELPADMKVCGRCGESKSKLEFSVDTAKEDGLKTLCKACVKKQRENEELTAAKAMVARIDDISLQALERFVADTDFNSTELPHMSEVVRALVEVFGGPRGIAAKAQAEYLASAPGGQIRQRYLNKLLDHTAAATKEGYAKVPVDLLSDEDLMNQANDMMERVLRNSPELLRRAGIELQNKASDAEAIDAEFEKEGESHD